MRTIHRCALITGALLIGCSLLTHCNDKTNPQSQNFPVTLIDTALEAGRYHLCWDQCDRDGDPAYATGRYSIEVLAGVGYHAVIPLPISRLNPPAPQPDCDGTRSMGRIPPPTKYWARLSDSAYAPGDTIGLLLDIPILDEVTVLVHESGSL